MAKRQTPQFTPTPEQIDALKRAEDEYRDQGYGEHWRDALMRAWVTGGYGDALRDCSHLLQQIRNHPGGHDYVWQVHPDTYA